MAYNSATLTEKRQLDADETRLVVRFSGNAGETPSLRTMKITATTTALELRRWAIEQARQLNNKGSVADNLTVGATIDLTPIP